MDGFVFILQKKAASHEQVLWLQNNTLKIYASIMDTVTDHWVKLKQLIDLIVFVCVFVLHIFGVISVS